MNRMLATAPRYLRPTGLNDVGVDGSMSHAWKELADDWRNGAVVYQVFVDRFAPQEVDSKRHLYAAPRTLRRWGDLPQQGSFNEEVGLWGHELDFWGGDLRSLAARFDYIVEVGADILYLNPIFHAVSNHKYDPLNHRHIDPAYGTPHDFEALVRHTHDAGMRIMLDGVFNHVGRGHPFFQDALQDPHSAWRRFFTFTDKSTLGYIAWKDVANLPELRLDDPLVRNYLYDGPDSIIQHYLRDHDVDGWRLDVAYQLGQEVLRGIIDAAHGVKRDSNVIGDIWNYPAGWDGLFDGAYNMHVRDVILHAVQGSVGSRQALAMIEQSVADAGLPFALKSWLMIDCHDTPRLANLLQESWQQRMVRILQFTLPGSPLIYYGSELGMTGEGDPTNRAPMRWDLATDDNATLKFFRQLVKLRHDLHGLRYGDFRPMSAETLFAFMRAGPQVQDTAVVVANPTAETVREVLQLPDHRIHDDTQLQDRLSDLTVRAKSGLVEITLPPHEISVLSIDTSATTNGYSPY